jgi:uncharacterized membrane protein YphA (DoxX/SURF4 family)
VGSGTGVLMRGRRSEIEHRAGWRNLLWRPADRLFLLKTTVIVAFCAGLLMCPALWIGPRSYPTAPVWSLLPPIEGVVAAALYGGLFLLAALAIVLPRPGWCTAGFLAIIAVFCLTDQTRWQPWVFQYGFLLGIMALTPRAGSGPDDQARVLDIARLVVALTYVFSGLQKINLNFMENDFPWIVSPITNLLPSAGSLLGAFGFVVPFIQVAFGIGLLTQRYRRISLWSAVCMHLFILAMFGPAGLNWNNVIWPWTATMAAFDVVLFSQASDFSWRKAATTREPGLVAAIVLFALLPLLSFFNLWDSYLSSALYSGNLTDAQIYLSDTGAASVAPAIKSRLVHTSPDTNVLNIQRWAMEDLNVMPYAETRVFKVIAKSVCSGMRDRSQLVLIVREQRMFFSRPESGYRCAEL